jgi:hypothetical protein
MKAYITRRGDQDLIPKDVNTDAKCSFHAEPVDIDGIPHRYLSIDIGADTTIRLFMNADDINDFTESLHGWRYDPEERP